MFAIPALSVLLNNMTWFVSCLITEVLQEGEEVGIKLKVSMHCI